MSHHSDDALLIASSDSFWEPHNYKRTTKRIEDGHRLCNDLMALVQERSEIEKAYAKSLKSWSKKWMDSIEKGPEYGTTEAGWKGVLTEADRLSEVHLTIKDNLLNDVQTKIKEWQKNTYHKSLVGPIKEKKDMDEQFKKAQKPWAKLLTKVNHAKRDFHSACKNERTAVNQERNATSDQSIAPEQVKKLQDRVQKSKDEVQKTKERYEVALREINDYNAKYMEDMKVVFDKCQEFEQLRLTFFKDMLFHIHRCLNISEDARIPQIYVELHHTIQNADYEKDLRYWSNNHGYNMAMNWPQFEEYSEEFRDIAGRGKTKGAIPDANITLLHQRSVGEDLPEYSTDVKVTKRSTKAGGGHENNIKAKPQAVVTQPKADNISANGKGDSNPFDDEEWEEYPQDNFVDNGEPGVPVKALYDYEGAEADELTFKTGDVFEKLEEEDEQGWCKGRKDGRIGLYPANYVEIV